ncbi:MAG: hypothetical protein ACW97V_18225 [Promethearchaeota archaeon]|jgi:hypothetical protein
MNLKISKDGMLAIGMFSLTIAILLGRFGGTGSILDFLSGTFTGLSLTMNLGYLIRLRIEKNSDLIARKL